MTLYAPGDRAPAANLLALPAVSVPSSGSFQVTLPGNVTSVLLQNESPYYLQVSGGGSSLWLPAWFADVLQLDGSVGQLTVTVSLIGSSTNAPSAQLMPTVAFGGERIPGTYPCPLDRLTSLAAGSVSITAGSVSISGNVPVQNVPGGSLSVLSPRQAITTLSIPAATPLPGAANDVNLQAGCYGIAVGFGVGPSGAYASRLQVVGKQTGIQYTYIDQPQNGIWGWVVVPGFAVSDTQVTITINNQAGLPLPVYVDALMTAEAVLAVTDAAGADLLETDLRSFRGKFGQLNMASSLPVAIASDQTWTKHPYDFRLYSNPGAGIQASVTIPAVANKRIYIDQLVAALQIFSGTTYAVHSVNITDGGTARAAYLMGCQGSSGATDRLELENGAYVSDVGNAVVVAFNAAPAATNNQTIAVLGWQQ